MNSPALQQKVFLLLLVLVTLAFGAILLPFYGAVFWAAVSAIVFAPVHRRIRAAFGTRHNVAALVTLLLALVIVIIPLLLIANALVQEATSLWNQVSSGQFSFRTYFDRMMGLLPPWLKQLLDSYGLGSLSDARDTLSSSAAHGSQAVAQKALILGQSTVQFLTSFAIMLYLLFFLLRDGPKISARIRHAIPLSFEHKRRLFENFTTVVRATVKGNIAVAAVQGALGGVMFFFLGIPAALLWGALMAFLSLLPAIGAGLVWGPVAIYLLATGSVWQGITMIVVGVVVIGLIDNLLRPLLVGKDTHMPDYLVLISTVGGMALFGLNGFVIGPAVAALFIATWDLFAGSRELQAD
ncbi:AI-2E family transporter [Oxalobacteraceae bacterium OM1]|nr:AI-2E family transporter [Oxalobacteraceae bacterium OM1]